MAEFNGKGKLAALDDFQRLMALAELERALPKETRTGLKIKGDHAPA